MNQKSLAKWLGFVLAGAAVCAAALYFYVVPVLGASLVPQYDETLKPMQCAPYVVWLIVIWMTAVPVFMAFVYAARIVRNIGADRSFTDENAKYLKRISILAALDSGFFFAANIVLIFLSMNHPGVLLGSLVIVFIGVCVTVAAAALSHLVHKAAVLQDDSDLTI